MLALPLEWWQPANYDSVELATGFAPDPWSVFVTAGGPVDVFKFLGSDCIGFATQAPDIEVSWTGGPSSGLLRFYFVADNPTEDAVLVVSDTGGNWACGDDSFDALDPTADYDSRDSGVYDIWVASRNEGEFISGTFYITEIAANHP